MLVKTIFKCSDFEIYSDKNGKFWLWDFRVEQNWAMKCSSEIECYRETIKLLLFSNERQKEKKQEAYRKLNKVEILFEQLFNDED